MIVSKKKKKNSERKKKTKKPTNVQFKRVNPQHNAFLLLTQGSRLHMRHSFQQKLVSI